MSWRKSPRQWTIWWTQEIRLLQELQSFRFIRNLGLRSIRLERARSHTYPQFASKTLKGLVLTNILRICYNQVIWRPMRKWKSCRRLRFVIKKHIAVHVLVLVESRCAAFLRRGLPAHFIIVDPPLAVRRVVTGYSDEMSFVGRISEVSNDWPEMIGLSADVQHFLRL